MVAIGSIVVVILIAIGVWFALNRVFFTFGVSILRKINVFKEKAAEELKDET